MEVEVQETEEVANDTFEVNLMDAESRMKTSSHCEESKQDW